MEPVLVTTYLERQPLEFSVSRVSQILHVCLPKIIANLKGNSHAEYPIDAICSIRVPLFLYIVLKQVHWSPQW